MARLKSRVLVLGLTQRKHGGLLVATLVSQSGRRAVRSAALIALALGTSTVLGCNLSFMNAGASKEANEATQKKLVGVWIAWHPLSTEVLELRADNTFRFRLVGDRVADFSGTWEVKGRNLEMDITKFVDGDRSHGDHIKWGIEKVESNELVLIGSNQNTTYTRQQQDQKPQEQKQPDPKPQDQKQPDQKQLDPKQPDQKQFD